jgi:replicative DNA helicase
MAGLVTTIQKNGDGLWHTRDGRLFACVDEMPGTVADRLPPHDIDAERAVLGSILIDPDAFLRVSTFLAPADFYLERHAWVFESIKELYERRQPADILFVRDDLERKGRLEELGGDAYLTGLTLAVPTSVNVEHYAQNVANKAVRRRLIDSAGQIARLAYDEDSELDEVVDRSESTVFKVTGDQRQAKKQNTHISDVMGRYVDRVEYLQQHRGQIVGIPTGLTNLDRLLGGLQNTDMVVLAARPGMGKTSMALNVALNAAKRWQKRVGIYSLEMSDLQLVQRLVASESGIDSRRLQMGDIKDDEWSMFIHATSLISGLPIFIDDTPAISALELRSKVRRLQAEHGLDLLIVDYLQLMRGEDRRNQNREQEVSYISRSVKGLAKELNIPILALSQLSRECEGRKDKRPILSDLRDSGSIEQDADVVIFLYLDEVYNPDTQFPNIAEVIVSKHRNGPTGVFSVYFKKHVTQFVDLEVRKQPLYEPTDYKANGNGNGHHVSDVINGWQEKLA